MARPVGTKRGRHRYLTEAELAAFMKAAKKTGPEEWLMMALAYYYGLRAAELVGLRWTDVDLDGRFITIARVKRGRTRPYEIFPPLLRPLADQRRRCAARAGGDWVFLSPQRTSAGHVTAQTAKNVFKRIAARAGIVDKSIHSLRHTCAMERARAGDVAVTLSAWLGQKRPDSVAAYVTAAADARHEAALAPVVGRFLC